MVSYAKPRTLDEALALLSQGAWRIVAGGTDFYPAQGQRPIRENILDINGIEALRGIGETPTHHVFGARTTWTDVIRHALPPAFDALKQAAAEVGSVQIQNVASLAGNLCNASPAADGVPPLMVLDAEVELRSAQATRYVALPGFILGNRNTALRPGEMVTAIRVHKAATGGTSSFFKLGARRYLVISIAMAAVSVERSADGTVARAGVSVGSCSAVAQRLLGLETALVGLQPTAAAIIEAVSSCDLGALSPIDDVRASAQYRGEAAREILRRVVLSALGLRVTEAAAA